MRMLNETGLPITIARVAEALYDSHPKMGDHEFSVTESLKSIRQIVLKRRHSDEMEADCNDTFPSWLGTAVHDKLEKESAGDPDLMTETRMEMPVETPSGTFMLSGEFDLLDVKDSILYDYKTSKVATIDGNRSLRNTEWLEQMYVYAEMIENVLRRPRPEKAVIVAMATDWSKLKTIQSGYPQHPIQLLEWPLDDDEFRESVMAKVRNHMESAQYYLDNPDENLPRCTYDDCWCTEDYAVMKIGSSKAYKRFSDELEARGYYLNMPDKEKYRLYHRASDYTKCRYYCECAPFCSQWESNQSCDKVLEDITDTDYIPF